MTSKRERFFSAIEHLPVLCPVCRDRLRREGDNLSCDGGHILNVNRKGYIHTLGRKTTSMYDGDLFDARRTVLSSGAYQGVVEAIDGLIPMETRRILDAGCGDGWWLYQILQRHRDMTGAGCDLSRDGIEKATDWETPAVWALSDLRNLPFDDGCFDTVLNILSPAAYQEFERVLSRDGRLIKVYPRENYLREIREAMGVSPYLDGQVEEYLEEKMEVTGKKRVLETVPVTPEQALAFVQMSPLCHDLKPREKEDVAGKIQGRITIDLEVAAAKRKSGQ